MDVADADFNYSYCRWEIRLAVTRIRKNNGSQLLNRSLDSLVQTM